MKAEDRKIFLELTEASNATLCLVCKYADFCGGGSICDGGDGYYECNHPIESLSFMNTWEEELEPGTDCYGFYPRTKVDTLVELASVIIENGIDEWSVDMSKTSFILDTIQYGETRQKTKYIRYRYNTKVLLK